MNARWVTFAEGVLAGKSATKAASDAGYSAKSAYNQGNRLMKNDEVKAYIAARLAEKVMPADEVLERLTQHARGNFAPFLAADGTVDLSNSGAQANIGLLKKVKVKERTFLRGDTPVREVETEIELHDPQAALVHIGRHYGLFVDKIAPTTPDGSKPYEAITLPDAELERIAGGGSAGAAPPPPGATWTR